MASPMRRLSLNVWAWFLPLLLGPWACRAFLQPPPTRRIPSTLWASVNGESTKKVKSDDTATNDAVWRERPRKLVDRSDTFFSQDAPIDSPALRESTVEDEELCFLDDIPGTDAHQTCFVSDSTSLSSDPTSAKFLASLPFNTRIPPAAIDFGLRYVPFIMPLVAYSTYEPTAKIFERCVEIISNNNWVAVDGGQYQANIITPAINGLVVPSIALLFATMTSNTINTLRQRQLQIRTSLNTEANDLRMLSTMVDSLPPELREVKNHLREYIIQYASRVVAESRPGLTTDLQMYIGSMDSEMNGFLGLFNKLSMSTHGTMYIDTMLPAANYTVDQSHFQPYQNQLSLTTSERQNIAPFLSPYIFSESYDALTRLRHERSVRLSALQSTYPALHYVILGLLAGSICTVFLMETNQDLLLFLSAIQLRILWSMLIGTFSALAVVNYDMRDPFRGNYNVAVSVDQFYTIRESIRATIQMDQENEEDSRTAETSVDDGREEMGKKEK